MINKKKKIKKKKKKLILRFKKKLVFLNNLKQQLNLQKKNFKQL